MLTASRTDTHIQARTSGSKSLGALAAWLFLAAMMGCFAVHGLKDASLTPIGALVTGAFGVMFLGFAATSWGKYRKPPLLLEATAKGIMTLQPSRGNKYPQGIFIPWRDIERVSCEDVAPISPNPDRDEGVLSCVTLHLLPGHRVPVADLPLRGANTSETPNTLYLDVRSNFGTPIQLADALERLRQTV